MKWNTLTSAERAEIAILKEKGYSMRSIAKSLGRSPNTISYELRKNMTFGKYEPKKAEAKSHLRKRMRRFQWRKLNKNRELKKDVIAGLSGHWNPDEIAGRMKHEKKKITISKNSIYRWLYSNRGQKYCHLLYSKRYRPKPRHGSKKRVLIPNRVDISKRFRGSENRTRYGHWEKDAVVSIKGVSASLAVSSERKSRLYLAQKVRNMSPVDHELATRKMLADKKSLSITRDNGIENIYHEHNETPSFFCRPYASWQKGGVENANKLLRAFFPKGTDFRTVTQEEVDEAVWLINNKPRKILKYKTALEVASAAGIISSIKSEGVLIGLGI
jgi:IS30 family transposase